MAWGLAPQVCELQGHSAWPQCSRFSDWQMKSHVLERVIGHRLRWLNTPVVCAGTSRADR